MRRQNVLRLASLLVCVCVLLSAGACKPETDGSDGPSPEGPSAGETASPPTAAPVSPEPDAEGSPRPEAPGYALDYGAYELIGADIADVGTYSPETGIFPLVNTPTLYRDCVTGPVVFVNGDGERIPLPDGVDRYFTVYQIKYGDGGYTRSPQCILLVDKDGKTAVMRLDGSQASGFDYDFYSIGEDYPEFQVREGYIVVAVLSGTYRFGLLNIRTGELDIPCVYDRIELCGSKLVYAEKDGSSQIMDFSGGVIMELGQNTIENGGVVYSNATEFALPGDAYVILDALPESAGVYRTHHDGDVTLYPLGELNLLVKNRHQEDCVITVTDGDGEFLFAAQGLLNFWIGRGGVIVDHDGILTAVTPDSRVLDFNYPVGMQYIYDAWYEDGSIHAKTALDYYLEELRVIAPDGTFTSQQIPADTQTGSISFRESEGVFEAAYLDGQGEIVIPYGLYVDFYELEGKSFVLAYTDWGTSPAAIYDRDGRLLLDSVYGVIDELYTTGKLVVYRDGGECGFLSPDGAFTPIPDAPAVSIKYYGG